MWRSEDNFQESGLVFSSTLWGPGIQPRSSDLAPSALLTEPCPQLGVVKRSDLWQARARTSLHGCVHPERCLLHLHDELGCPEFHTINAHLLTSHCSKQTFVLLYTASGGEVNPLLSGGAQASPTAHPSATASLYQLKRSQGKGRTRCDSSQMSCVSVLTDSRHKYGKLRHHRKSAWVQRQTQRKQIAALTGLFWGPWRWGEPMLSRIHSKAIMSQHPLGIPYYGNTLKSRRVVPGPQSQY